jgi:hypothetical protein
MHVPSPGAAKMLVAELGSRFPAHHLMEALGLVYPQYWCVEDARENFEKHMHVIKAHYCHPKSTHQKKARLKRRDRKEQGSVGGIEEQELATGNSSRAVALQVRIEHYLCMPCFSS